MSLHSVALPACLKAGCGMPSTLSVGTDELFHLGMCRRKTVSEKVRVLPAACCRVC